jgi:hypothetical protein
VLEKKCHHALEGMKYIHKLPDKISDNQPNLPLLFVMEEATEETSPPLQHKAGENIKRKRRLDKIETRQEPIKKQSQLGSSIRITL